MLSPITISGRYCHSIQFSNHQDSANTGQNNHTFCEMLYCNHSKKNDCVAQTLTRLAVQTETALYIFPILYHSHYISSQTLDNSRVPALLSLEQVHLRILITITILNFLSRKNNILRISVKDFIARHLKEVHSVVVVRACSAIFSLS